MSTVVTYCQSVINIDLHHVVIESDDNIETMNLLQMYLTVFKTIFTPGMEMDERKAKLLYIVSMCSKITKTIGDSFKPFVQKLYECVEELYCSENDYSIAPYAEQVLMWATCEPILELFYKNNAYANDERIAHQRKRIESCWWFMNNPEIMMDITNIINYESEIYLYDGKQSSILILNIWGKMFMDIMSDKTMSKSSPTSILIEDFHYFMTNGKGEKCRLTADMKKTIKSLHDELFLSNCIVDIAV